MPLTPPSQKRAPRRPLLAGWTPSRAIRDTQEQVRLSGRPAGRTVLTCVFLSPEDEPPLYPPPPAYVPQPEADRNTLVPDVR